MATKMKAATENQITNWNVVSDTYNPSPEEFRSWLRKLSLVYDRQEYRYSVYGIEQQLRAFYSANGYLINLFRQHPAWDHENYVIRLTENYDLSPDENKIRAFWYWVLRTYYKKQKAETKVYEALETFSQECPGIKISALLEYSTMHKLGDLITRGYNIGRYTKSKADSWEQIRLAKIQSDFWRTAYDSFRCELPSHDYGIYWTEGNYKLLYALNALSMVREKTISDEIQKKIGKIQELKSATGKRIVKVVRKLCECLGISGVHDVQTISWTTEDGVYHEREKDLGYDYQISQFADAINPPQIEKPTFISISPIDFLYMSCGHNWKSCHWIGINDEGGGWHAGTVSYMLDSVSFVFYTLVDDPEDENPSLKNKLWRSMCHYDPRGKLLTARIYPQSTDSDNGSYEIVRNIVQTVIATCLDQPNYWSVKKGCDACNENVESREGSLQYEDYFQDYAKNFAISTLKSKTQLPDWDPDFKIEIGGEIICPDCGEWHSDNTEHILCDNCSSPNYDYICNECGYETDYGDDGWFIDGEWYCCDSCAEDAGYVCTYDREEWCEREDCRQCDDNGRWYYYTSDFIETVDGYSYRNAEVAERNGYMAVEDEEEWYPANEVVCTADGENYRKKDCYYCGECREWIYFAYWNKEHNCCENCVDDVIANEVPEIVNDLGIGYRIEIEDDERKYIPMDSETGEILNPKDVAVKYRDLWTQGEITIEELNDILDFFDCGRETESESKSKNQIFATEFVPDHTGITSDELPWTA